MNDGPLLTILLPLAMFIMMLGLGTTLTAQAMKSALKQRQPLTLGLIAQLLVMPACAAVVVSLVSMPAEFKLGIMLLACCPGGTTSNLFVYLGKGNLALSITMTTFSSLMVIFTMPIILQFSADIIFTEAMKIEIPKMEILKRLFAMTIVPVMLGIAISHYFPKAGKFISDKTGPFGLMFLLFLVGFISINEWHNMKQYLASVGAIVFGFNALVIVAVMLLLKLSSLNLQDRFTIYIEACIQSSALAMFIALTVLENGTIIAIPAGIFSITMYVIGFGITWQHRFHKARIAKEVAEAV